MGSTKFSLTQHSLTNQSCSMIRSPKVQSCTGNLAKVTVLQMSVWRRISLTKVSLAKRSLTTPLLQNSVWQSWHVLIQTSKLKRDQETYTPYLYSSSISVSSAHSCVVLQFFQWCLKWTVKEKNCVSFGLHDGWCWRHPCISQTSMQRQEHGLDWGYGGNFLLERSIGPLSFFDVWASHQADREN